MKARVHRLDDDTRRLIAQCTTQRQLTVVFLLFRASDVIFVIVMARLTGGLFVFEFHQEIRRDVFISRQRINDVVVKVRKRTVVSAAMLAGLAYATVTAH